MLPDFPAIKAERARRLLRQARANSLQKHGVLPQLASIHQPEGDAVHLTDVHGDTAMTSYEQSRSGFDVHADELPKLDDAAWLLKLEAMTDTFADGQMKLLIKRLEEVTASTGNIVSADGQPLSERHVLQMFDKMVLDFDGDDIAPGYAFLTSPEMGKRLAEMQVSDDFKQEHAQILDRQRIDWRLREADRKLVD